VTADLKKQGRGRLGDVPMLAVANFGRIGWRCWQCGGRKRFPTTALPLVTFERK
jgi:hypothetical protein